MRPALAFLAAAALVTAVPGDAHAAQRTAPGLRSMLVLRPCASSHLRAAVASDQQATLHRELLITLTNTSTRACAINGYPAVRLLDDAKNVQIVAESFSRTPHLFTIAPGDAAAFLVRDPIGDGVTTYRTASTLAVIPPGDVTPIALAISLPAGPTIDVTALLKPSELQ